MQGSNPERSLTMNERFVYLSASKCLYGRNVYVRDASHVFRLVFEPGGDCYVPVDRDLAAHLNALWNA